MLCEKCKQREATVHKEAIINGVAHSEHLCAECAAKERGGWDPFASFLTTISLVSHFQVFQTGLSHFSSLAVKRLRKHSRQASALVRIVA